MRTFFLRLGAMLLIIFLQLSFLDILFPSFTVPILILTAVVAWTLLLGFPEALTVTVPLTLLFDTVANAEVSFVSVYVVFLSYGTIFLSKRLMIEHHGMSLLLYALFAGGGVLLYQLSALFLSDGSPVKLFIDQSHLSPILSLPIAFSSSLASLPVFMLIYSALKRFERWENSLSQKQFLNIR